MTRPLTTAMANAFTGDAFAPAIFVELEFDSTPAMVWSGIGDLTWDSKTWSGLGELGGVDVAEETTGITAAGAVFTLSGVPSEYIALALSEDYQERPASMWLGAFDLSVDPPTLIADPTKLFGGRMDVMTPDIGPEESTIAISAENRYVDFEVPKISRYTPEDQKAKYPGDTSCNMVGPLQDSNVIWGRSA